MIAISCLQWRVPAMLERSPGPSKLWWGNWPKSPANWHRVEPRQLRLFILRTFLDLPYSALEKRTEYPALNLLLVSLLWVYWNGSHHTHLNHWYLFTACWYLGVPRTCQSAVADWYWSFAVHQWIVRDITFQSVQNKWVDDQDSAYLVLWYKDIFGTPIYR